MKQKRRVVFTEYASEGPEMVHMALDQFSRFPQLPELFFPSFWTRKASRWTGCPTFALFEFRLVLKLNANSE